MAAHVGRRNLELDRSQFVGQTIDVPGIPRHRRVGNCQFVPKTKVAPGELVDAHHLDRERITAPFP